MSSDHSVEEKAHQSAPETKIDNDEVTSHVDPVEQYEPSFIRSTMRKVDIRLLPILGALYSFSLIDRTNISLARVMGADEELGLTIGVRYNVIAVVFFIPYILFELPSNIVLRRVGVARWLGLISFVWGATMVSMGFVHAWNALAGLRVLLGALEAGFFPGCVYLISTWYIRREVQTRMAFFYLTSTFVSAFNPIIAYGISIGIPEAGGLLSWRWLFIIEGLVSCAFAFLAFFLIVDFPDKATFLNSKQAQLVRERVEYDRGDSIPDTLTLEKALKYAVDPKPWAFAVLLMCATMPAYGFAYFLPIILSGMGYSPEESELLTAPPFVLAVILGLISSNLADRANKRGPFILFQATVTITGLAMTAYATSNAVRYAGVFLGVYGSESNIPAVLAYQANNIVGQSKRSFSSALMVGFGGIGGILASLVFRQQDFPTYRPGLWATIGSQLLMISVVLIASACFIFRNRQVRNGTGKPIEGQKGFFYTL